jgi:HEAT repeat protein
MAGRTRPLLRDDDAGVHCVAAWCLYCAGRALALDDAVAVLQETLKAPDPWARRQAAGCLGSLGPAAGALAELRHDPDDGVRDAAARALAAIRQK